MTPSGLDDSVPVTLENVENIVQTFRNASETHVSEREKSLDHLGWSTRVGRVIEFRKFPKIMKNHDF